MWTLKGFSVCLFMLAAPALAEQPERVLPEDTLTIPVGGSETLRFKSSFDSVNISSKGVVQATAQTDRVLTLVGEAVGLATVTVRGGGQELYTVAIEVTGEPGHL